MFLAKTGRKLEGSADDPARVTPEASGATRDAVAVDLALRSPGTGHAEGAVTLIEQTVAVAQRAVLRTVRQRALLIFPMVFPLILFAINGSALSPRPGSPASRPTIIATS